jgi:hypothetical protein
MALEVIHVARGERSRHPGQDLRKAMYHVVAWYRHHQEALQPVHVTALAYALGVVDRSTGETRIRRDQLGREADFIRLASWVGIERHAGRTPSLSQMAGRADVSVAMVRRWKALPLFEAIVKGVVSGLQAGTAKPL